MVAETSALRSSLCLPPYQFIISLSWSVCSYRTSRARRNLVTEQFSTMRTTLPVYCHWTVLLSGTVNQAHHSPTNKVTPLLAAQPFWFCSCLVASLLCFSLSFILRSASSSSSFKSSAAVPIHPCHILLSCTSSHQLKYNSHFLRSSTNSSFHCRFWPPTEHLPPAGLNTSKNWG